MEDTKGEIRRRNKSLKIQKGKSKDEIKVEDTKEVIRRGNKSLKILKG
jgi:hypothetical protein